MKPLLNLDTLLGTAPLRRSPQAAISPSDDTAHRLVHIVWANGEGLETGVPTRGTALLQHGFKEWSAASGVTRLAPRGSAAELEQAVQHCEAQNWTPLVFSRDLEGPLHLLEQMRGEGDCGLLALGSPFGLHPRAPSLGSDCSDLSRTSFPVRIPGGVDPRLCIWLGAPPARLARALDLPSGLRIASRDMGTGAIGAQLQRAESRLCAMAPPRLWCLVFLDDVQLGGNGGGALEGLPAAVLAASLRWLQRQLPWVVVCLVSHERVTVSQRPSLGELARQMGRALHHHHGVPRGAFPAAG